MAFSQEDARRRGSAPTNLRRPAGLPPLTEQLDDPSGGYGGIIMPAWFASVPYQGILPRSSRSSVVPTSATQPPAVGPPRRSPRSRAQSTPDHVPRGIRTGSADARSVTRHQKTRPDDGRLIAKELEALANRDQQETKSRGDERQGADCHDPNDVELQVSRHSTSVRLRRTLARSATTGEQDLSTEGIWSEALQRCASGECQSGDCPRAVRSRMRRSFIGRSSAILTTSP